MFIDILVDDSDDCEGCALRFKAEDEPRPVWSIRYPSDDGPIDCIVIGRSTEGDVPAMACTVEDSSGGTATLIWGGNLGVRLTPMDGRPPFAENHLRISPEDVLS